MNQGQFVFEFFIYLELKAAGSKAKTNFFVPCNYCHLVSEYDMFYRIRLKLSLGAHYAMVSKHHTFSSLLPVLGIADSPSAKLYYSYLE